MFNSLLAATAAPVGIVVGLGLLIVFAGLIVIVAVCYIMGLVCKTGAKTHDQDVAPEAPVANAGAEADVSGEFVAAVSAVIAEDLGRDVSTIRILSIKKI